MAGCGANATLFCLNTLFHTERLHRQSGATTGCICTHSVATCRKLALPAAQVTLTPSTTVRFLPHPESDPLEFSSPDSFVTHASSAGLYGGLRLLQAMCLRLFQHCRQAGIQLPSARGNFTLAYTTTIPRQRGLSGSSAIATAALNCLLRFYDMETAVPPAERPQLVLEAEQALGITAGLQDRVIQVGRLVWAGGARAGGERAGR